MKTKKSAKNAKKRMPGMKMVIGKILDGYEFLVLNEYYIHGARREDLCRHLKVSDRRIGRIHDSAIQKVKCYYKEFQHEYNQGG